MLDRLIESGVIGRLTVIDCMPFLLFQLLPDSFSLFHLLLFLTEGFLSLYQEGMFSLAIDRDTLLCWGDREEYVAWSLVKSIN